MIVIVDVDDVSLQSMPAWLAFYNEQYDDKLRVSNITDWDMVKFVKPECGIKVYDILHRPDFYEDVLPVPGARRGVKKLKKQGHRVLFVTAGLHPQKLPALQRYGFLGSLHTDWDDYLVCFDKKLIRADAIIDDNLKTILEFPGLRILFDQPWNRGVQGDFHRVRTWKDAVAVIIMHSVYQRNGYW